jgi:hypothetical protein
MLCYHFSTPLSRTALHSRVATYNRTADSGRNFLYCCVVLSLVLPQWSGIGEGKEKAITPGSAAGWLRKPRAAYIQINGSEVKARSIVQQGRQKVTTRLPFIK